MPQKTRIQEATVSNDEPPRRRLLITGFPPFVGRPVNPTQQLVYAIRDGEVSIPDDLEVFADLVPVEYVGVEQVFRGMVEAIQPEIVLAFGVGHSGALLHLEQWGFNLDDSPVPDNTGTIRQSSPIAVHRPQQLPTTLDVAGIYQRLIERSIDVTLSNSAGRFLCNHLLYYGLELATQFEPAYQMTFVHVRPLDATGGTRPVEFEELLRAVEELLRAL